MPAEALSPVTSSILARIARATSRAAFCATVERRFIAMPELIGVNAISL
jgi:hypothetical protein